MPMADVILLAHFAPDDLPSFALGAQWAQMGVVACGALGVAITIALPRCVSVRRATWLPAVLSTAISWGACIALFTGALALAPTSLPTSGCVTAILAAGMLPLSIYAALASFYQCVGQSNRVLRWAVLAGLLNFTLDLLFINAVDPAVGVACATALCWSGLCMLTLYQTCRQNFVSPSVLWNNFAHRKQLRRPWKAIRRTKRRALAKIALPDFFSKVGFVGAMGIGFWWLSSALSSKDIATLAAALNYMNLVFVLVVATITAFGITFLGTGVSLNHRRYAVHAGFALALFQAAFFCISPIASYIYFGEISLYFLWAINLSTLVVLVDGAALFLITLLRMYGVATLPPYIRLLMFPCAAFVIGVSDAVSFNVTALAMLLGNVIVALCLCGVCVIYFRASTSSRVGVR